MKRQPLELHDGLVVPMDRSNVDTDAILPKQFMKLMGRSGLGQYAFDAWRYLDEGMPGVSSESRPRNMAFALNQPRYRGASILLTQSNFGCGSSREHAPWALIDLGIRVIIARSVADIFKGNCVKNGLLPIELEAGQVDTLMHETKATNGYRLTIDLRTQRISTPSELTIDFTVDPGHRDQLLNAWDEIDLTLRGQAEIRQFEARRRCEQPWLFGVTGEHQECA